MDSGGDGSPMDSGGDGLPMDSGEDESLIDSNDDERSPRISINPSTPLYNFRVCYWNLESYY